MPEPDNAEIVHPLSVVVAVDEAFGEAARAALDAAGIGPQIATVESEPPAHTRRPVLLIVGSIEELHTESMVEAADRDFVLLDDVHRELAPRVRVLHERAARRRARLGHADQLRDETMRLTWEVHSADTLEELVATAAQGVRDMLSTRDVAVLIPVDPDGAGDAGTLMWTTSAAQSLDDPELFSRVCDAVAKSPGPSPTPLARPFPSVVELHDRVAIDGLFGVGVRHAMLAPVNLVSGARGALIVADGTEPGRRTEYERDLVSYVATQIGRAVSELWLRDRQRASEEQLQKTSAELQRLVNERDDLGVVVRSIADAVNVGVMFFDNDNRPQLHNRMVERLLGLAAFDQKTGLSRHVYGSDRHTRVKEGKNIVSETLEGDQRGLIYWMGDPQGEQRAVVTEAHTISKPDGERLGSAIVTYDVTDLANAIEIREEYLATVSHELRTPLTSIVGYLDLIDDSYDVDEFGFGKEFRTIQRSTEQMLALIRDLLSTSTRELSLRIEPVDLSALLTQCVSTFRPTLEASHQKLDLELPGAAVLAHLDAGRIRQVVDNLISNATKYTREGGVIRVGLQHDDEHVVITVADNGFGISKADQSRLFDRFFRARDAREAAIQGVGIGLTIVQTIVVAHGGTVSVDSEPGQGSTFTVRLPMRAEATPLPTLPLNP
jgi:signal transduction histidine kinase